MLLYRQCRACGRVRLIAALRCDPCSSSTPHTLDLDVATAVIDMARGGDQFAILESLNWSNRRLRLLAAACVRYAAPFTSPVGNLLAAELAETMADGNLTDGDRQDAIESLHEMLNDGTDTPGEGYDGWDVGYVALQALRRDSLVAARNTLLATCGLAPDAAEWQATAVVNFGRPGWTFDPNWRTETVARLAHAIYEARAFGRMPVLADALEEAGCGDEQILSHCRGDGLFALGDWVLDECRGQEHTPRPVHPRSPYGIHDPADDEEPLFGPDGQPEEV